MKNKLIFIVTFVTFIINSPVYAQLLSTSYEITDLTFSSGSGSSTSASYEIALTLGQPVVGSSSSASYEVSFGFVPGLVVEVIGAPQGIVHVGGYALYTKTGRPMANAAVYGMISETGDTANTTSDASGNFDLWINATFVQGRIYTVIIKAVDQQGTGSYLSNKFTYS